MEPVWDHNALKAWFSARSGEDVSETELLNAFLPDSFPGVIDLKLFQRHFLLNRRLWLFDDELRLSTGQRLWIHGIRVTLLEKPLAGQCGWLDQRTGQFCVESAIEGYCHLHDPAVLEINSMKSYYLDTRNLRGMTEEGVNRLMDGFFGWINTKSALTAALDILSLPENTDAKAAKARWRKLSLDHHPDRGGDPAQFQKLSAAWDTLKRHL